MAYPFPSATRLHPFQVPHRRGSDIRIVGDTRTTEVSWTVSSGRGRGVEECEVLAEANWKILYRSELIDGPSEVVPGPEPHLPERGGVLQRARGGERKEMVHKLPTRKRLQVLENNLTTLI